MFVKIKSKLSKNCKFAVHFRKDEIGVMKKFRYHFDETTVKDSYSDPDMFPSV